MKTTLALGAVAALLLVFILVYERGSVSSTELQGRAPAVLQHFVRDRVTKLEIQRAGETTVLERVPDPESGFEHGLWELRAPMQAQADQDAVDVLLGELEWMDNRRRMENVSASDRARFGLDAPRYRVWFTVGSERLLMRVGGETPTGDAVYIEGDRPGVVFVVGKDLPEALDHPPGHYHSKEMHDGIMLLSAEAITLRGEHGEAAIEKRDNRFRLVSPVQGLVDREALSEVFRTLDRLRAARFVSPKLDDPARYGLDAPVFEAIVRKRSLLGSTPVGDGTDKGGKPGFETVTRRLRLGGPCEGHASESYFIVDDGPIFCVVDGEVAAARKGVDALREPRLLVLDDDQIGAIEIASRGERLVLTPKAGAGDDEVTGYRLRRLRGERELAAFDVDGRALGEWLAAMRGARADAYEQGAAEGPVAAADTRLRFERLDDAPAYTLAALGDGLVRRADEPQLVRFGPEAATLLDVPAARFRERTLFRSDAGKLAEVEITRAGPAAAGGNGNKAERVTRNAEGRYMLTAPVALPADAPTMQDLGRLLGNLQAERFVADVATPRHGLGADATVVKARFGDGADAQVLTLRLGAPVESSRYATLEPDPAVFVLPAGLVSALSTPLVSRDLLAIGANDIQAVTLRAGKGPGCVARREGDALVTRSGFSDAAQAQDMLQALASLRALGVTGFDAPASVAGAAVHATLTVETAQGTRVLRILPPLGAQQADARAQTRYPAVRDDLAIGFELSAATVDRLLACTTPSTQAADNDDAP